MEKLQWEVNKKYGEFVCKIPVVVLLLLIW
jgi:hypothetical protein